MFQRILCAGVVALAASPASAQFLMSMVDLGGGPPDTMGSPIPAPAGAQFFEPPLMLTADPLEHAAVIPFAGSIGAGIGVVGIQSSAPTAAPGANVPSLFLGPPNQMIFHPLPPADIITPTEVRGKWTAAHAVIPSGSAVNVDGLAAIWIARIGITTGFSIPLHDCLPVVTVSENGTNFVSLYAGVGGGSNPVLQYDYRITSQMVGGFQGFDVFDIYIEQIVPAPGAFALLIPLGFTAARRRR